MKSGRGCRSIACDSMSLCSTCVRRWRRQVIKEIARGVAEIQNGTAGTARRTGHHRWARIPRARVVSLTCFSLRLLGSLGEHKIRDLNDKINKLLREKRHWERQIKSLGGPDYHVSMRGCFRASCHSCLQFTSPRLRLFFCPPPPANWS